MTNNKNEQLENLKNERIIWIISIFLAVSALISNYLKTEDVKNNSNKNRSTYRSISITIFVIALLINFYFFNSAYNNYKKTRNTRFLLTLLGSILAIISVSLFLTFEILNILDDLKEE